MPSYTENPDRNHEAQSHGSPQPVVRKAHITSQHIPRIPAPISAQPVQACRTTPGYRSHCLNSKIKPGCFLHLHMQDGPEFLNIKNDPDRLSPVVLSLLPFRPTPEVSLLPSTGITRSLRYYKAVRHPASPTCSSRNVSLACASPPTGLPVLPRLPSSMHASATTPAETIRCIYHFPSRIVIGLPLHMGGSASALTVSRPARRSYTFRPAWLLSRLHGPSHQSASVHIVTSVNRPGCYQPKR